MKNKNKIIQIVFFIITLSIFGYTNASDTNLNIKDIVKGGDHTLKINFDSQIPADRTYTGDMKVFKDLGIDKVTKDSLMSNKITLSLNDEIKIGSTYNILSVFGVEGSADFIVENASNVKMLSDATDVQGITKVVLKDSKTLELYFKAPIVGNEFEFKGLEDLGITETKSSDGSLILKTSSVIENNKDYILIFMSLADNLGNNYLLSESIYNFTIGDNTSVEKTDIVEPSNIINNTIEPDTLTGQVENLNVDLGNTENGTGSVGNIENIAVTAEETPDTGPETWILMLLTLIINSIYFLTRKFSH
ncbi:MAG: hypothetical protein WC850_05225 [Candidatus Gracilibacteria bacterium]